MKKKVISALLMCGNRLADHVKLDVAEVPTIPSHLEEMARNLYIGLCGVKMSHRRK